MCYSAPRRALYGPRTGLWPSGRTTRVHPVYLFAYFVFAKKYCKENIQIFLYCFLHQCPILLRTHKIEPIQSFDWHLLWLVRGKSILLPYSTSNGTKNLLTKIWTTPLRLLANTAAQRQADIDAHPSVIIDADSDDKNDPNSPLFWTFYENGGALLQFEVWIIFSQPKVLRYGCD